MRLLMLEITLGCLAALSMASGAVFARRRQRPGGSGGGNAHSAATAGMTHWGDPAPSPLDAMPGGDMKKMESMDGRSAADTGQ
ncbi:hypothetical protein [Paraburkholderia fynbosensis]|uniref:Uncharacterized protein n=1 Tax=Paraburkholderia fynbosensis TaxID=1200993 RepID=A0A6J5FRL7_9BURK|nr:hypothetical protein [Paraburkholderia fynbosensis]CAB3785547.1 hypothetical protein LMG27177_01868 [Paraburkholderia fynbosensis]